LGWRWLRRQPKPAPTNGHMPQTPIGPEPHVAVAGDPASQPRKGFVALSLPPPTNGSSGRPTPRPRNRPPARAAPRVRAFGYVSVPPRCALDAGSQARVIEAACAARGWTFVGGVREHEPAIADALERPGLQHVLERFERGEANCLVVAELRRLSRSAVELGGLLDRLGRAGVRLLVLDVGIDTGTEDGQLAAGVLTGPVAWPPSG
jgi:hypothetical protein